MHPYHLSHSPERKAKYASNLARVSSPKCYLAQKVCTCHHIPGTMHYWYTGRGEKQMSQKVLGMAYVMTGVIRIRGGERPRLLPFRAVSFSPTKHNTSKGWTQKSKKNAFGKLNGVKLTMNLPTRRLLEQLVHNRCDRYGGGLTAKALVTNATSQ